MRFLAALFLCLGAAGCGWYTTSLHTGPARSRTSASSCALSVSGTGNAPLLAAELPDGALIVGSARRRGGKLVIALRRIEPDCRFYSLPSTSVRVGELGSLDTMVATPQAELLVGGSDGKHALVGRLMATGRMDSSFGNGGWVRLAPHEKSIAGMPPPAFDTTSISVGPAGAIVVGGNDGGPHCCTRDFVSELAPTGKVTRTLFPPGFGGSYTTDVYANADGSVYVLGEYEQSGCGDPTIVRIDRDGSLDKSFDAAIAQTVRSVARVRSLRFTPTLVPAGGAGFLLVGGLDRTCLPSARYGPGASGGVVVAVKSSGRIGGKAGSFYSPGFAFDSPTVVRLRSGWILAGTVVYTSGYKAKRVLVQSFGPGGTVEGGLPFPLPPAARVPTGIALFDGPAGYARLVIGSARELDVTSLPSAG